MPLTGMHLKSLGASVTVIVRPLDSRGAAAEAAWRKATSAALNEGKRVEELDLKSIDGATRAQELVREADICLVGFSRGVARKLGMDAATCHAANSRLIHVTLPAFADDALDGVPHWESAILAAW